MEDVLDKILSRVQELSSTGEARPALLFDIDDTLLSTAKRHLRILREFASQSEILSRHLHEAWTLIQLEPAHLRYAIADTARAAGVSDTGLLHRLKGFWFDRFFKNDYLMDDVAIPGAAEYCRGVAERGGRLIYLTGRDITMRKGTLYALRENGFPLPNDDGIELILKPRFDMPDLGFKSDVLKSISPRHPIVAGFENEPAGANLFQESFPQADVVWLDTKHSGRPVELAAGIHRISDFRRPRPPSASRDLALLASL